MSDERRPESRTGVILVHFKRIWVGNRGDSTAADLDLVGISGAPYHPVCVAGSMAEANGVHTFALGVGGAYCYGAHE